LSRDGQRRNLTWLTGRPPEKILQYRLNLGAPEWMDEVIEDSLLSGTSLELERRLVGDYDERKTQHHLSRHLGGFVHRADGGAFPTEGRLEHRHVVLLTAANQNVA
jgi:hypothetical protein